MATVIFSNQGDRDCEMLRHLWAGLDANVVELTDPAYDCKAVDDAIAAEEDLLIVAGHGSPHGLFAPRFCGYAFSYDQLPLVRAKRIVCVWCYASEFVKYTTLKNCFATYMFVSNPCEAQMAVNDIYTQDEIDLIASRFYDQVNVALRNGWLLSDLKPFLQGSVDTADAVDVYNRAKLHYQ